MIIENITLENFRTHSKTTFTFGPRKVTITGPNGSGKTCIRMAIEFALFGKVAGTLQDNLVRHGTGRMTVTLTFTHLGNKYIIRRSLVRSKKGLTPEAVLYRGAEVIARGTTKVTNTVKEIIGIDEKTFSILNPSQGTITNILDLSSTDRSTIVDALLGIGKLRILYEKLRDVIKPIELRKQAFESQKAILGKIIEKINENELNGKILEITSRISKDKEELDILERKKAAADDDVKKEEEKMSKIREAKDLLSKVELANRELEYAEAGIKEVEALKIKVEAKKRHIEDSLKSILDELSKIDVSAAKKAYETAKSSFDEKQKELMRYEERAEKKKMEIEVIEKTGACPTCERPVDPTLIEQLRASLADIEYRRRLVADEVETLQDEVTRADGVLRYTDSKEISLSGKKTILEDQLREIENEVTGVMTKLQQAYAELANAKRNKDKLSAQLEPLKQILEKSKDIESDYIEKVRIASELQKKVTEKMASIKVSLEQQKQASEELQELHAHKKEFKELSDKFEKVSKLLEEIISTRELCQEVAPALRTYYLAMVEEELVPMFSIVSSAIRYGNIRLLDDYMPIVRRETDILATEASGGEQVIISILLRLAIAKVLARSTTGGIESLILDEPVEHGVDAANTEKLIELLEKIKLPQIIIITHEEKIANVADKRYHLKVG